MEKFIALGMLLVTAGLAVIAVGIAQSLLQAREPSESQEIEVRAGGVILIGPVPIVFGTDRSMVTLSIAGALLLLAAYYVWRRG
jgi:uncharacterized protein (TIGR00304 family)